MSDNMSFEIESEAETVNIYINIVKDGKTETLKVGERPSSWDEDAILTRPLTCDEWKCVLFKDFAKMPFMARIFKQYLEELDADVFVKLTDLCLRQCCRRGTPRFYADMLWGTRRSRQLWIDTLDNAEHLVVQGNPDGKLGSTNFSVWEVCDDRTVLCEETPMEVQAGTQDLEESASVDKQANVTFVDERPIDAALTRLTGDRQVRETHHDISESPWNIRQILTREVLIDTFVWKAGQQGEIETFAFPEAFIKERSVVKTQLQLCGFLRSAIEVRVVLNGNKFMIGRLIAHIEPLMTKEDHDVFSPVNYPCFPHVLLDASVSNSAKLTIPFSHFLSFLPQRKGSVIGEGSISIGRLMISVLNPLQCPTGATQALNGTVYARFVDPVIHQTCYAIDKFGYGGGIITQGLEDGNLLVNRSVGVPCYGDNDYPVARLSLDRQGPSRIAPEIDAGNDFDLMKALQTPCLGVITSWKDSHGAGDAVFRTPISPTYISNATYFNGKGTTYVPTYLAYISRCFAYFSGDIMIKVQVVGNAFSSGRLMHIYDPTWTPDLTSVKSLDELMNYNCVIQDVQEQQEMVLRVPFMSIQPFLRCDHWSLAPDYEKDKAIEKLGDCYMGLFQTVVLNPLIMPSNMTSHIDINYFFYAAENFRLMVPVTLEPLQINPPSAKKLRTKPIYPAYQNSDVFLDLPNKRAIRECWLEGKRLWILSLINDPNNWWEATPEKGLGYREEVYRFVYRAASFLPYVLDKESQQYILMVSLGRFSGGPPIEAVVQGLEDYTSTRETTTLQPILMTKDNRSNTAPMQETNALKTFLYRYYPLFVSNTFESISGFTSIHIPVKPTFVHKTKVGLLEFQPPPNVHQVAWISSMYNFWSGSLKYKIMVSNTNAEIFACYVPQENYPFSIEAGASNEEVQRMLSYASVAAISHIQGSLEIEIPFSSKYTQCMVDRADVKNDARFQNGTLFLYIRNRLTEEEEPGAYVTVFMGAGKDFHLNWMTPPPVVFDAEIVFDANPDLTTAIEETETAKTYNAWSRNLETPNYSGFQEVDSQMWWYRKSQKPEAIEEEMEVQGISDYMFPNLNQAARSLPQQIETFNASIKEAKDALVTFSGATSDAALKASHYMDLAASTLLSGNVIRSFVKAWDKPCMGSFLDLGLSVSALLGYNVRKVIVEGVKKILVHFSLEEEQAQAQAIDGAIVEFVDDHENIITKCFAVLGTILYAYVFDCMPDFSKLKQLIKSFLEEEPVVQGFDLRGAHFGYLGATALCKVFDNLVYYTRKFIEWSLEKDSPESLLARKAMEIKDRVLKLIRQLDDLDNEVEIIRAMQDPFVHNKFYNMANEANELTDLYLLGNMDARIGTLLTECRTRAKLLIKRLERESPAHGWRYDPFVICIHGPTGTGKTMIMREISNFVARQLDVSHYNRTYNKTINDEFWSGYVGQAIVHWDEFGQNAQKDACVGEFVELRGNDPHRLNMAALEDKGRYFTSRAILMTTNVPYFEFRNVIRDKNAFLRRRHMMIGMRHRPGANVHQLQANGTFDEEYSHCIFSIDDNMRNIQGPDMIKEEIFDEIGKQLAAWNRKQMALYEEYMLERGLGSMPRGVMPVLTPVNEDELRLDQDVQENRVVELPDAGNVMPIYDVTKRRKNDVCMVMGDETLDLLTKLNMMRPYTKTTTGSIYHMTVSSVDSNMSEQNAHYINNVAGCYVRIINPLQLEKGIVEWGKEKLESFWNRANVIFEGVQEKIINIYHKYPKLVIAGAALGTVTAVMGAYALISGEREEKEDQPTTLPWVQPEQAYDVHQAKLAKQFVRVENQNYDNAQNKLPRQFVKVEEKKNNFVLESEPKIEGNEDQCSTEIRKVIHPNLVVIGWEQGAEKKTALRGLHIGGQLLLTPHHFFGGAREGDRFILNHRLKPVYIEFNKDNLVRLDERDWCVYDCGPRFEPRKMLTKYFLDEQHLGKLKAVRSVLANVTLDGVQVIQKGMAKSVLNYSYKDPSVGAKYIQQGWETNFVTEAGDCGSFLMALTNVIPPPGKILGIHTAGYVNRSVGFSVLITRQMLERAVSQLPKQIIGMPIPKEVDNDEKVAQSMRICPEGDYSLYGTVPNTLAPAQPQKTCFEVTPFPEELKKDIPNKKKPAHLKPFDSMDTEGNGKTSPLKLALTKYGKNTKPFSRRTLLKAKKHVVSLFKNLFKESAKRVYTEEEAIAGIPGLDFADRLNMQSSPGWPYQVLEKGKPGKFHLFGDDCKIVNEELRKRLDERWAKAKVGERVPSLWRDCMKDELRPNAKVDAGKTRLFTIAPVDYTIFVRQLFMDFAIAFYGNSCNFFSAVGINPESYEWTKLYNYLAKNGKRCVAGDYSTFDGTLMPEFMDAVADIINEWYDDSEENKLARKVAVNEMIHTMQLIENCVYATHQGNPSGNPLTVIINTIVNYLYLICVLIEIYPEILLELLLEEISIICYGDDVLITVKEKLEKFNFNSIKTVLEEHGIGFTTDTKEDKKAPDYINLDDATFLKRGFRIDAEFGTQFRLPTMNLDTLYSYFHWVRKTEEQEEQFRENMRSALTFAAFYGREFYENYHNKWEVCMRAVEMSPLCVTFEEQVDSFLFAANAAVQVGADRQFFDNLAEGEHLEIVNENNVDYWNVFWKCLKGLGLGMYFYGLYKCWNFTQRKACDLQDAMKKETTDDRWAICIPSGEGKTTLARKHPEYFVDIDDIVLFKGQYPDLERYQDAKLLREYGISRSEVKNQGFAKQISIVVNMNVWFMEWIKTQDHVVTDRRVLLTHAPSNTRRKIAACFMLPKPTGIRNNLNGRNVLKKQCDTVDYVTFKEREQKCLEIVRDKEPAIFEQTGVIVPIERTVGHFTSRLSN